MSRTAAALAELDPTVVAARFWPRVQRLGSADCWEWLGQRRPTGYGVFNGARIPQAAHRVSFWLASGEVPETVLHSCDNPPCVNPAHLSAGTQPENLADMRRKGRGTVPPRTRLRERCKRGHDLAVTRYHGTGDCSVCARLRARQHRAATPRVLRAIGRRLR
jgi:hypothetical protein